VLLVLLVVWSLFAFGGAYSWTLGPIVGGALLLAAVVRPSIGGAGTRTVDALVVLCLVVPCVQLVPLPPAIRLAVSPALPRVDSALYLNAPADPAAGPAAPLTVDAAATAEALAVAAAAVLIFWSARSLFERGSVRRTVRTVAACGLAASAVAILQHATAPKTIYWVWKPLNADATPYGPFVSRNDLAAWLVLAIPLTVGYFMGRIASRRQSGATALAALAAVDETAIWLAAAVCAMTAALVVAVSRSGFIAAAVAMLTFAWLTRRRLASRGRAWLLVGAGLVVAVATTYASTATLMTRLNETLESGVGGRRAIWQSTRAMIADFPAAGVGVGAYARAMSVYQPPHQFAFNHAHDEYLQILAEGGVVLLALTAAAVLAGAIVVRRRLRSDRSPLFWIRAGAASGLVAIAAQSVWETGLRMPANAILFAVCAAIATHRTEN
jgi:O-antigen ligase